MSTHRAIMRQPTELSVNAYIKLIIREVGKKIGELHVSKVSIEWRPSNGMHKRLMSFSKFVKMIQEKKFC